MCIHVNGWVVATVSNAADFASVRFHQSRSESPSAATEAGVLPPAARSTGLSAFSRSSTACAWLLSARSVTGGGGST